MKMMRNPVIFFSLLFCCSYYTTFGFQQSSYSAITSNRVISKHLRIASKLQSNQSPFEGNSWLKKNLLNILIIPSFLFSWPLASQAANIPVYFGVGCFWHVQHEFVESEKRILGRTNTELT